MWEQWFNRLRDHLWASPEQQLEAALRSRNAAALESLLDRHPDPGNLDPLLAGAILADWEEGAEALARRAGAWAAGMPALTLAVLDQKYEALRGLLKAGLHPDTGDHHQATALMVAAQRGDTRALGMLLAAGAQPNCRDEEGDTALAYAVMQQARAAVSLLVAQGANPRLRNHDGLSPADRAADAEMVRLLEQSPEV
ncbi:MAG: ankyrin repeat domain-containing protein [Bacteroidia bacterium]|nr:ankyrin repeat domain-containing protein [Bacteroidia bacterium]